jgi:hypothetical protein
MNIYKNNTLQDCLRYFAFRNKYDAMANLIAREIFERVKHNNTGEFLEKNILINITKGKLIDPTFENFHVSAFARNDKVHLNISLDDDFSSKDYQRFNFVIYDVLRHELEHLNKYVMGKYPDEEYVKLYYDLKSKHTLKEHIEMVSRYILSDTEIDSYVKSIMYVAKKQNKSALEVIEQVIKRAFFGNNSEVMEEVMRDAELSKIINDVKLKLKNKLKEYYHEFREKWL